MYKEIDILRKIAKLSDKYLTTGCPRHKIELRNAIDEYEKFLMEKINGKNETTKEKQEEKEKG